MEVDWGKVTFTVLLFTYIAVMIWCGIVGSESKYITNFSIKDNMTGEMFENVKEYNISNESNKISISVNEDTRVLKWYSMTSTHLTMNPNWNEHTSTKLIIATIMFLLLIVVMILGAWLG